MCKKYISRVFLRHCSSRSPTAFLFSSEGRFKRMIDPKIWLFLRGWSYSAMAVPQGMVLLSDGCFSGDGPTQRWLFLRGWSYSAMAFPQAMAFFLEKLYSSEDGSPSQKWFEHNDMALRIWLFLSGYGAYTRMAASQVHCRKSWMNFLLPRIFPSYFMKIEQQIFRKNVPRSIY
jgi:hypothetical protein